VVDDGGTGVEGELRDHPFAGPDHENAVPVGGQQRGGHEERLVVGELGRLRALPLVVAEEGDAVRGVGDQHALVGGRRRVVHGADLPPAGHPGRNRLDDGAVPSSPLHHLLIDALRAQRGGEQFDRPPRVGRSAAGEDVHVGRPVLRPGVYGGMRLGQQRQHRDAVGLEPLGHDLPDGRSGGDQRVGECGTQRGGVVQACRVDTGQFGEDVPPRRPS
jgi:hypothetical protein